MPRHLDIDQRAVLLAMSAYLILTGYASGAEFDQNLFDLLPDAIKTTKVVKVAAPRQLPPNIYEEKGVLK